MTKHIDWRTPRRIRLAHRTLQERAAKRRAWTARNPTLGNLPVSHRELHALLVLQPALEAECLEAAATLSGQEYGAALLALRCDAGEIEAFAAWHHWRNPKSRCGGIYYISRNGGTVREYTSIITGESITLCAKYKTTKRVLDWMERQDQYAEDAYNTVKNIKGIA